MKKILLFCTILITGKISAQVLTSDATGESSIIYPGIIIGFDILETSIKFSTSNYNGERLKDSLRHFVWAVNSEATSNKGVADIFNKGDFSSNFKLNGFIGASCNLGKNSKKFSDMYSQYTLYQNILYYRDSLVKSQIDSFVFREIRNFYKVNKMSENDLKVWNSDFKNILDTTKYDSLYSNIVNYANKIKDKKQNCFLKILAEQINSKKETMLFSITQMGLKSDGMYNKLLNMRGYWSKRITFYLSGGLNTDDFKYFEKLDTANFSKSFENKFFIGYNAYGGVNFNWGTKVLIGANAGFEYNNNKPALSSKEYTLKSVNSNLTQTLTTEKKFTAYSGTYNCTYSYPVNFDFIYFANIMDSSKIALNIYIRQTFSDNKTILPNTTNLGLGVFLFKRYKSKFIGGLYIEAPDVENNIARMDPEAETKKLCKRLTFGLIAKFTFSSLFSYD